MELTDEELKQRIKDAEASLLGLKQERMAREFRLAEALLPAFAEKIRQHFGPDARVKADTDPYDHDALLVIEIPPSIPYEVAMKLEDQFWEDPESDKFCYPVFVHTRFVAE